MKTIKVLVDEMPSGCKRCDFCVAKMYCLLLEDRKTTVPDEPHKRRTDCPLVYDFGDRETNALNKRIADLDADNAELKERVAMLDVTAVYKSLGEMGYIEQVANLKAENAALQSRIAELKEELDRRIAMPKDLWFKVAELSARVNELELAQRWIPVSERLPELGSPILFYDSILERINKGTCTAMNSDNTNLHWFTDDDLFYFGDRSEYVTHWMPLPNPPEVK